MIGGEGPANPAWMQYGTWLTYAKKLGALCLMLEHRFYGKSHPTPYVWSFCEGGAFVVHDIDKVENLQMSSCKSDESQCVDIWVDLATGNG